VAVAVKTVRIREGVIGAVLPERRAELGSGGYWRKNSNKICKQQTEEAEGARDMDRGPESPVVWFLLKSRNIVKLTGKTWGGNKDGSQTEYGSGSEGNQKKHSEE
jgi:hypothetical protein